jgi:uncharacterized protein YjeT (DUF2065 family)
MSELLLAVGLIFLLEGISYALFPDKMKELMQELQSLPPDVLRRVGLIVATIGAVIIYFIKRL